MSHFENKELVAFGEAIRELIRTGEALSMFTPKTHPDPGAYRREAETVRQAWDEALLAYRKTPTMGVLNALTAKTFSEAPTYHKPCNDLTGGV